MKYTKQQAIALPTLRFEEGQAYNVLVKADIVERVTENRTYYYMHVMDLDTGEEGNMSVLTALMNELNEYAELNGGSLVGKAFEITMHPKPEDAKYRTFSVYVLELEDDHG